MGTKTATANFVNPLNTTDQKLLNDPYPLLKRLREEAPVHWSPADKYWLISKHADISAILKDNDFEKQIQTWKHAPNPILASLIPHVGSISKVAANWLLNLNPPAHTRVRSLVNKAFTGTIVQGLRPKIQEITDHLLCEIGERQQFDLIKDFATPLPLSVIGYMLGIPSGRHTELKDWSTTLAALAGRQKDLKALIQAGKAVEQLTLFLRPAIEERRSNPKDDLLSTLVQAEMEGSHLKVDELVGNCILLLIAGHETTTNLIGNVFVSLLRNQDQLALLRAQPELMASMISETLRYEGPAQTVPRMARKNTVICGQKIKTGDMCWLLLGSGNRDADAFENPDRFDITRTTSIKNLSFGAGIHRCVGASLAEVELEIAVNRLFAWRSEFKFASQQIDFKVPFSMRGPQEVLLTS